MPIVIQGVVEVTDGVLLEATGELVLSSLPCMLFFATLACEYPTANGRLHGHA